MKKLFLLLAVLVIPFVIACGSSSSSSSDDDITSNDTPAITSVSYLGTATAGDFAKFSMSSDGKLSYELSGANFNGLEGTLSVIQMLNNFYNATTDDGQNLGLLISENIGFAVLPNSTGNSPFIIGLSEPSVDITKIAGKTYIFIGYRTDDGPIATQVIINDNGTFIAQDIENILGPDNETETGCWEKSANGTYINALIDNGSGVDCSNIDESSTAANYLRIVIKPGISRAGFVVDYADGKGFGIGLEKKALESPNSNVTYDIFSMDLSNIILDANQFEKLVVNTDNTTTEYNYNCTATGCSETTDIDSNFRINYNKICTPGSTMVDFEGFACVEVTYVNPLNDTLTVGDRFNVFIDFEDGYFIAQMESNPDRFTFGAKTE